MSKQEGQNQDHAMESGKRGESSLTGLLHDFHDSDKKSGRTGLNWSLSPVLIASLCLSVVLIVGIYRIGVQGFRLREKVEELAQENTQLEETLKSIEKEVLYSKQEPESAQPIPAKSVSEKPRPVGKRTSEKPSKISKIMYRVRDGDSLSQIGQRFAVSVEQLRSWNRIEETDLLEVGQVLIINKTMTTEDLPYAAQDGGWDKVADIENEGSETDAKWGKPAEADARAESDYIPKANALAQIAAVRAETEAANKAIAQLEEKLQSERKIRNLTMAMLQEEVRKREALEERLTADYISKQTALEQINESAAKADAANKAIAQFQARLDSVHEEHGQRVAKLETEAERQKALERKSTTDYVPQQKAIEQSQEITAKVEAASRAVSELQTKLDSEVKKSEQTIAMLHEEAKKREALEERLAADYIPKQAALEQISEAEAKAEATSTAVAQLQARIDSERREYEQTVERLEEDLSIVWSDSLSREEDIEQIAAVRAEAGAAKKAIAQLQARLDSEVKKSEQRTAILQREVQKRKALEEKLATDYISKQIALEQISEAETKAEAANKAIGKVQAKLDSERREHGQRVARLEAETERRKAFEKKFTTDYIPKEEALEQIKEATAKAEAASRAVSELQTKLDSERKAYEQTVKRLEEEAAKEKDLEEEPVTERDHANRNAATGRAVGRQATSTERTGEYPATEGQETSTGKPIRETVHVIRAGENLYRIGIKYGVSWKTLLEFNNLVDADAIYVGQKIRIPRGEKEDARSAALDER